MRLKTIHHTPLTVLAITVLSTTAFGQVNDNLQSRSVRIVGRVTDATKAGVPNTVVTLNVPGENNRVTEVRSDKDGHFNLPSVTAQVYEIRFESPGFEVLKVQAKSAAEGGEYDVGNVVLSIARMGDEYPIFKPPSTPASPIKTTLCELVKEADHFHGEFVQFRTHVVPAGIDVSYHLSDSSSCAEFVWPHFPDELSVRSSNDLLLLKRSVLEQHHKVTATITGKFELVLVNPGKLTYSLKLESASELVVSPEVGIGTPRVRR